MTAAAMRFGLPGGRGALGADGESSNREAVRTADRLGFDHVWFSDEPALTDDGTTWRTRRSALVLATAAAVTTGRVRLGVYVTPAELRRPQRVAADLATLDVLSHGRVSVVLDAGGPGDFDTVLACWAGGPVTIDGERHLVEPAPAQEPHPPVFVVAHDDASIMWAGRRGHGLILGAALPLDAIRRGLDLFASHGGDPATARVERFCFVGKSDAEARRTGGPYLTQLATYLQVNTFSTENPLGDIIVSGGPETVAARIAHLRDETGVRCVNVRPSLRGHCPFELQRVTVDLFATEVVPRLNG